MTKREVVSFGLIAGMTYGEMLRMSPGMIVDLYVYRRRYDDEQHGIHRIKQPRCAD